MNIAVYCSSRDTLPEHYVALARSLGHWLGVHGHTLVYGGVNAGLMHVVAQATKDAGGRVVGIVPEFFAARASHLLDECIITRDMIDRKQRMIELAHHFVVLPGGLGTIEEWLTTVSHLVVVEDYRRRVVVTNVDGIYDHTLRQLEATAQSPMAHGHPQDISLITTTQEGMLRLMNGLEEQSAPVGT